MPLLTATAVLRFVVSTMVHKSEKRFTLSMLLINKHLFYHFIALPTNLQKKIQYFPLPLIWISIKQKWLSAELDSKQIAKLLTDFQSQIVTSQNSEL